MLKGLLLAAACNIIKQRGANVGRNGQRSLRRGCRRGGSRHGAPLGGEGKGNDGGLNAQRLIPLLDPRDERVAVRLREVCEQRPPLARRPPLRNVRDVTVDDCAVLHRRARPVGADLQVLPIVSLPHRVERAERARHALVVLRLYRLWMGATLVLNISTLSLGEHLCLSAARILLFLLAAVAVGRTRRHAPRGVDERLVIRTESPPLPQRPSVEHHCAVPLFARHVELAPTSARLRKLWLLLLRSCFGVVGSA